MRMTKQRWMVVVGALGLTLSACGDDVADDCEEQDPCSFALEYIESSEKRDYERVYEMSGRDPEEGAERRESIAADDREHLEDDSLTTYAGDEYVLEDDSWLYRVAYPDLDTGERKVTALHVEETEDGYVADHLRGNDGDEFYDEMGGTDEVNVYKSEDLSEEEAAAMHPERFGGNDP